MQDSKTVVDSLFRLSSELPQELSHSREGGAIYTGTTAADGCLWDVETLS